MRFATTAIFTLLVASSAVAKDSAPEEPLHYTAHVQLTAGSAVAVDQSVELVDRHTLTLQGTAKDDSKISYTVKLTPYVVTGDRVGMHAFVVVKTQGPTDTITTGGKTMSLPSSTTCSVSPKAILDYNTPTKLASTTGVNNGNGHVIPGCEITVTLSKPQAEAQQQ